MLPAWARRLLAPLVLRPAAQGSATYGARAIRLLRRRWPSIVVFLVIVVAFDLVRSSSREAMSLQGALLLVTRAFPWTMALAAIVAPILVEATGIRGVRLAVAMTLATLALVGVIGVIVAAVHPAPLPVSSTLDSMMSNESFLYRGWWVYSVAGLLFAAYCQARERERDVLRAARAAELERADTQREIVASRLKVLQARVEPELLFGALADVRATYLVDPAAAGALLDDLVAYLRAALPQMRGGASTLAREAALAEAYLRVVPAGRSRDLATRVSIPRELADTDFPPMVLLPLVHAAADAAASGVQIAADLTFAKENAIRLAVTVHVPGTATPPGWSDDALHVVRETVAQYLGPDADLVVNTGREGVTATVTWPDPGRGEGRAPPPAPVTHQLKA